MKKIILNQAGQGLTEYLILLVLIGIASIAVTQTLGKTIKEKIKQSRATINAMKVQDLRSE